jgi:hypothetical protein
MKWRKFFHRWFGVGYCWTDEKYQFACGYCDGCGKPQCLR